MELSNSSSHPAEPMGAAGGGNAYKPRRGGPKTLRKARHTNRAAPLGLLCYYDSLPQGCINARITRIDSTLG
jgi:hypothetical protein